MFFDIKDGKVYKCTSPTSSRCVYNESDKAIKVLISPDETKAIFLTQKGNVKLLDVKSSGIRSICGANGPVKDIAWDGPKTVLYKAKNNSFIRWGI